MNSTPVDHNGVLVFLFDLSSHQGSSASSTKYADKVSLAVERLLAHHSKCRSCDIRWGYRFFNSSSRCVSFTTQHLPLQQISFPSSQTLRRILVEKSTDGKTSSASVDTKKRCGAVSRTIEDVLRDVHWGRSDDTSSTDSFMDGLQPSRDTKQKTCPAGHAPSYRLFLFSDNLYATKSVDGHVKPAEPFSQQRRLSAGSKLESAMPNTQGTHDFTQLRTSLDTVKKRRIQFTWVDTTSILLAERDISQTERGYYFRKWLSSFQNSAAFIYLDSLLLDRKILPFSSVVARLDRHAGLSTAKPEASKQHKDLKWSAANVVFQSRKPTVSANEVKHSLQHYFQAQISTPAADCNEATDSGSDGKQLSPSSELVLILKGYVPGPIPDSAMFRLKGFERTPQLLRPVGRRDKTTHGFNVEDNASKFAGFLIHLTQRQSVAIIEARDRYSDRMRSRLMLLEPITPLLAKLREITLLNHIPELEEVTSVLNESIMGDKSNSFNDNRTNATIKFSNKSYDAPYEFFQRLLQPSTNAPNSKSPMQDKSPTAISHQSKVAHTACAINKISLFLDDMPFSCQDDNCTSTYVPDLANPNPSAEKELSSEERIKIRDDLLKRIKTKLDSIPDGPLEPKTSDQGQPEVPKKRIRVHPTAENPSSEAVPSNTNCLLQLSQRPDSLSSVPEIEIVGESVDQHLNSISVIGRRPEEQHLKVLTHDKHVPSLVLSPEQPSPKELHDPHVVREAEQLTPKELHNAHPVQEAEQSTPKQPHNADSVQEAEQLTSKELHDPHVVQEAEQLTPKELHNAHPVQERETNLAHDQELSSALLHLAETREYLSSLSLDSAQEQVPICLQALQDTAHALCRSLKAGRNISRVIKKHLKKASKICEGLQNLQQTNEPKESERRNATVSSKEAEELAQLNHLKQSEDSAQYIRWNAVLDGYEQVVWNFANNLSPKKTPRKTKQRKSMKKVKSILSAIHFTGEFLRGSSGSQKMYREVFTSFLRNVLSCFSEANPDSSCRKDLKEILEEYDLDFSSVTKEKPQALTGENTLECSPEQPEPCDAIESNVRVSGRKIKPSFKLRENNSVQIGKPKSHSKRDPFRLLAASRQKKDVAKQVSRFQSAGNRMGISKDLSLHVSLGIKKKKRTSTKHQRVKKSMEESSRNTCTAIRKPSMAVHAIGGSNKRSAHEEMSDESVEAGDIVVPATPVRARRSRPCTPAAETPAAETPTAETPTAETPAAETPAAETPTAQTPAAQTPSLQKLAAETPVVQTPAAQTPSAQTSSAQTPAAQTPAAQAPAVQTFAAQTFAAQTFAAQALAAQALAAQTPVLLTPAPLSPAPLTPALLTPAPLTPALLTPAPLTPVAQITQMKSSLNPIAVIDDAKKLVLTHIPGVPESPERAIMLTAQKTNSVSDSDATAHAVGGVESRRVDGQGVSKKQVEDMSLERQDESRDQARHEKKLSHDGLDEIGMSPLQTPSPKRTEDSRSETQGQESPEKEGNAEEVGENTNKRLAVDCEEGMESPVSCGSSVSSGRKRRRVEVQTENSETVSSRTRSKGSPYSSSPVLRRSPRKSPKMQSQYRM